MLGGKIFSGGYFRSPGLEKTVGVMLACWAAAVLVFAALPAGLAIVDLEKAAQQGADQNAQLRQVYDRIEQQLGSNTLPMDVWLDEQGRVVRLEMNMPMPVPGGASSQEANGRGQIGITEEFYDFGTPVSVEAPPEDQTADINDLISAQQAPNPQ